MTEHETTPPRNESRGPIRPIAWALLLLTSVTLVATYLIGESEAFKPEILARFFLFGFTLVIWALLLILTFVLGRNLIKLFVERRRKTLGATFKTKLVIIFIGFALLPSALIILIGSRVISASVDRWFSHPVEEVLLGAQVVALDYAHEKQQNAEFYARLLSRELSEARLLTPERLSGLSRAMEERLTLYNLDMITVLSSRGALWTSARPGLPNPESTNYLAERGLRGEQTLNEDVSLEGTMVQYVEPVLANGSLDVEGAVVVSYFIPKRLAATVDEVNRQANAYQQEEAQKEPIQDLYLSFFVMVSLLLLLSSTWLGLYVAKRISVPVAELLHATERVTAGDLDHPMSVAAVDELGLLVESFNRMTAQLKASQQRLESSRQDLEKKNRELDRRRGYIETVLENITTGVVSLDREGFVTRMNQATLRMLQLETDGVGRHYRDGFPGEALAPLRVLLEEMEKIEGRAPIEEEVDLAIDERELHLSVYVTVLRGRDGVSSGSLMVLDDLTQLLRAQKVAAWREVARRLAHEIKNPLTPIQLSAQRIRKHYRSRSEELERVVEEGTGTIIDEVDSLKNLVDEFSQFARLPTVSSEPQELTPLVNGTLELYDGLFDGLEIRKSFASELPPVLVDQELMRRVLINIIDNAIEASDGKGDVLVETRYDESAGMARIEIADHGPGIDPENEDKLFMPYYSTKRRGSGLGLAIVKRIVAEHRGRVFVVKNEPSGARFVIELPVVSKTELPTAEKDSVATEQ